MRCAMCLTHACAVRRKLVVQKKTFLQFTLLSFGIALLFAGLFFDKGMADSLPASATPTPNRLAEPTMPASPSQADRGAKVYWLSCLPCHGDKGQGLTDEFRTTYPPEDRYCWERGCHGERPYEQGFTLPTKVPAVIGQNALAKFSDAAQLNAYIRAAMPFWKPGLLTEEEAWSVTAFILRQNDLWDDQTDLNPSNAPDVKISQRRMASSARQNRSSVLAWAIGTGVLLLSLFLMFILKKIRNTTTI